MMAIIEVEMDRERIYWQLSQWSEVIIACLHSNAGIGRIILFIQWLKLLTGPGMVCAGEGARGYRGRCLALALKP